ncbi:hypothetical protein SESBI_38842 [Sesbania bispinosa]|nr:hypothetical protein SESBI_38842 [Sesbania bispinosa]
MEGNIPVLTKKVWNILRVAFFMLRKGVSKGKIMMDLNMTLKRRGKLAGKAITNLMFHHHAGSTSSRRSHDDPTLQFSAAREYEFSCSNTPNLFNKRHRHNHFFACAHAPATLDDDAVTVNAVKAVLEMLNKNEGTVSPALPGFGRSPMVRQLRVTDSPFPMPTNSSGSEIEEEKDNQVDKAAEEFIKRFYMELRKQA